MTINIETATLFIVIHRTKKPEGYGAAFDHEQFYEWVRTRDYPVWFSSYEGIEGFKVVWKRKLRTTHGPGNNTYNTECLYTNA